MEQLGQNSTFHFMFGYQMVQIFEGKTDSIWNRLQIIRSAPGGGKTSLLKFFTVDSMSDIYKYRENDNYKKLFETLNQLGVFQTSGLAILGVYLSCTESFSRIEDLNVDPATKDRLFFSLLNVRALFGVLKAVCVQKKLSYPEDLKLINLNSKCYENPSLAEFFPDGNGQALLEKGREIERRIIRTIDSVSVSGIEDIPCISNLLMWQIFGPGSMIYNGESIEAKALFMLDDIHDLAPSQRSLLLKELEKVYPTARWVAERYEALETADSIYTASIKGREYNLYRIEQWASDQKSKGNFQKGLEYIANRRVFAQKIIETMTFESLLDNQLSRKHLDCCQDAIKMLSSRVHALAEKEGRFDPWIQSIEEFVGDDVYERAAELRALEILIQRKRKREQTLFPDYALTTEEMEKMDSSAVQKAGKLFVAAEFGVPYYYDLSTLKQLSSGNVEQFLSISGDIFEELLALNTLRRREANISVERQESIIKHAANEYLEQLPKKMISGTALKRLVLNVGQFARDRTFATTAPYAPGVTGIGISEFDQHNLSDRMFLDQNPQYCELANVLREAVANNVFEARSGQQCKGRQWLVLYLNRLLCVYFNLPLEYGGWKEQSIDGLNSWLKTSSPKQNSLKWTEGL